LKLKGYRESAEYFSKQASDLNRQLCYAGIAIIWIFRQGASDALSLPKCLYLPLILFAVALAFDLLQYLSGYLIWDKFHKSKEKEGKREDDEVLSELSLQRRINIFFYLKIGLCLIGFAILIVVLVCISVTS